jgi:hypothetical protein
MLLVGNWNLRFPKILIGYSLIIQGKIIKFTYLLRCIIFFAKVITLKVAL